MLKPRILIVDDIALNREFANIILQQLGCHVSEVRDGAEALEALAAFTFDLILMDVDMPVMDGLTATAQLREREISTPILAFTTLDNRDECLAAGMDGHIAKPMDPDDIREKLEYWLGRAA